MKNYDIVLFLILTISYVLPKQKKTSYDLLLEWGKNHSVFVSDKIAMNYTDENNRNYYVKQEIKKGEVIISIPTAILLNIESALKLSGPKIKKQFEAYKKQNFETKIDNSFKEIMSYRVDQSFLAYLMTVANKNKSKKSKFYQFYKYYFNTFETDLERYPLFYNTEQMRLLMFTQFGNELMQTKEMFDEEFGILEKYIYKKTLDQDEYTKYRIFSFNKLVNVSGISSLVPFIDFLETNPVNSNLQLNSTNDNKAITIVAKEDIKVTDRLVISVVQMPNSGSYITYGRIYEENKDYVETYKIPKVCVSFLKEKKLDPLMATNEIVELTGRKFFEEALQTYQEISLSLKEDGSIVSALRLFFENMKLVRKEYDTITPSVLYKTFFQTKHVKNIKSILDTEKRYLDKKIRQMKKVINEAALNKDL